MPKKLKLTDEELSRVLGMAEIGKLDHWISWDVDGFACVGGAALMRRSGEELFPCRESRFWSISVQASPGYLSGNYPEGPDAVLRMLEERGLA